MKTKSLKTLNDVEALEHTSESCSEKYVPIKTTEFIKELKDFDFIGGYRYRGGSTAHYVRLSKGDDVTVLIENSFDRSLSLRISFEYNEFVFGRIKQKHLGEPAKEINNMKSNINEWYTNAIKTIDSMRTLNLPKSDLETIAKIAMKARGVNLREVHGIEYNHSNVLDFIQHLIHGIKNGDFYRMSVRSGLKEIKPVQRESLMIEINHKIWKYLIRNNPELQV